ncbi:MAG: hypothetical protein ACK6DT_03020, partial [Planctomycetota bacterium]
EVVGGAPAALGGSWAPGARSCGNRVHAVVGRWPAAAPLQPCPREVARTLCVPLTEALDDARWRDLPPPGGATGAQPATSPHGQFGRDLVWGLTGRFLRELAAALR